MKKVSSVAMVLALALLGCSRTPGPSRSDLQARLSVDLPHPWAIDSFSVEASENVGTNVEPLVKNRFKATLVANDDTYETDHQEGDVALLKKAATKGERRELYGVASSAPKAGSWQTGFDFENDPFRDTGKPRSSYQGRTIVLGTAEESDYREKIAQAERDKQAAEAVALRERVRVITEALSSGRVLPGTQTTSEDTFRFELRFQSFDPVAHTVKGENRWFNAKTGALKLPNAVAGTLAGDKLTLTEQVRGGENGSDFALTYSLALAPSMKQLQGEFSGPGGTGHITVDLR